LIYQAIKFDEFEISKISPGGRGINNLAKFLDSSPSPPPIKGEEAF
jgi:hypothetical protein